MSATTGRSAARTRRWRCSATRGTGDHPVEHLKSFAGILQADSFAGYNRLYATTRLPGPVTEVPCWAHGRRKFFELADIAASKGRKNAPPISPLAMEAVKRIDVLFEIERSIKGESPSHAVRQELSAPLVAELETWMRTERARLSRHAPVAKAMDYMLRRWDRFTRFLDDGRICLSNNAAERALRGIALGRKSWLFAGSDRGGRRAMYTLIGTAKLNNVNPQAWLADVLRRIAETPQSRRTPSMELAGQPAARSRRIARQARPIRPACPEANHNSRCAATPILCDESFCRLSAGPRRSRGGAIRGLIERIVLTPGEKRGQMDAVLHGERGTILEWAGSGRGGKEATDSRIGNVGLGGSGGGI